MSIRNKINCATRVRNVGVGKCSLHIKEVRGEILVPKGWKIPASALLSQAAFRAYLEAAIIADDPLQRIYPVKGFAALTDNSEEVVVQTLAYGQQLVVRDGNVNWTFQYYDGGICLSNALRSFNGADYDTLFWDSQNILFGTTIAEADGSFSVGGVPQDMLYALPWTANDGANVSMYRIAHSFQPAYINERIGYVQAEFNLADLNGLKNISLVPVSSAAGVITFQALTGCDGENMYSAYSADLADELLYTAVNAETGALIAIDTVTAGAAAAQTFILTLDTADPDYPTTADGLVTISMVGPTALAAAGIEGFEGLPMTYKRG